MQLEQATGYVKECFSGEPASCSYACPFRLDLRAFMQKAAKGRWGAAYKTLRNAVVFPVVVSRLCPQPCRDHCQRATVVGDEALAVRDLEAAVIRYAKSRKPEQYTIPPKTKTVAVVGAGLGGLSAALSLAQKKFPVTVFNQQSGWGGVLRDHPDWALFDEDIALQFSAVETDFRFDTAITSLDELAEYDTVIIATGDGGNDFGLKDSWDEALLTTSDPKVFLTGGLVGMDEMDAIAAGPAMSKTIEVFLQTGRSSKTHGDYDRSKRTRYLRHNGVPGAPLVTPASPDGYSEDEAKAEASRCMLCDCEYCERNCEMLEWFRKKPHKIGVEVYSDANVNPPFSSHTMTREAYSCNICGKCKEVCPVDVDMGALLQFSREDRWKTNSGIVPALHDYWLREFDFHSGEAFMAAPPKGQTTCEYLFFPGCQLGAAEPDHVIKSYDYLRGQLDIGLILGCCGAPAYWAGDRQRLADNADRLTALWAQFGKPTFVFACAYCEKVFDLYMPDIPRVSLYEIMARDTSFKPSKPFDTAAVFDPCAARDDDAMQSGVRTLAENAGVTVEELENRNRCCGYGGHISLANPGLYNQITEHRKQASDKPYVVYCANCQEVFRQEGKDCAHILDMAFGINADKRRPDLQSKWDNSRKVKSMMMKDLLGEEFIPESAEWSSLQLTIPDALLDEMDRKLIIEDDLKEAIWRAEASGDIFVSDDGLRQCSMVKSVLTYWVQYRKTSDDTYEIVKAYTHRMKFNKEG